MPVVGFGLAGLERTANCRNGGFGWTVHIHSTTIFAGQPADGFQRVPVRFFSAYQHHAQRIEDEAVGSQYLDFSGSGMEHGDPVLLNDPLCLQV